MILAYPQLTATLAFVSAKMQADPHLAGMLGDGVPLVSAELAYNPFEVDDDDNLTINAQQMPVFALWPTRRETAPQEQGGVADGDDADFTLFYGYPLFQGAHDLQPAELVTFISQNVWWRVRRYLHKHRLDDTAPRPQFMQDGGIRSIRAVSTSEFMGDAAGGCFISLQLKYYEPPYQLPPPVELQTIKNALPLDGTGGDISEDGDFDATA